MSKVHISGGTLNTLNNKLNVQTRSLPPPSQILRRSSGVLEHFIPWKSSWQQAVDG